MFQSFGRKLLAREHAPDFARARCRVQFVDGDHGAALSARASRRNNDGPRSRRSAPGASRTAPGSSAASFFNRRPTPSATPPPMPASTSSNTRVRTEPPLRAGAVTQVFSASAMREISPPEAILSIGLGSSPRFGDTRNSTASWPARRCIVRLHRNLENRPLHRQLRQLRLDALGEFFRRLLPACAQSGRARIVLARLAYAAPPAALPCARPRAPRHPCCAPPRRDRRAPLRPSRRTCAWPYRWPPAAFRSLRAAPDSLRDRPGNRARHTMPRLTRFPPA